LFFCLKGERFNANKFATQALGKGASYVVVDDPDFFLQEDNRMILVEDSLVTLQNLAKYHREQVKIPVIGITGTNGKTTTKELVAVVLNTQLNCLSNQGNFNNHIGVPLTLLRITQAHEIVVIEMGANHPGEIADLCKMSQPDYGIITNIGRAHLEGFGSFENIIETKSDLYRFVDGAHGLVFVNHDDDLLMKQSRKLKTYTYGQAAETDVCVNLVDNGGYLSLQWKGKSIHTKLFGQYNLSNAAAAIAVGSYFKIQDDLIANALEQYSPSNNRSQLEKGLHNELILDAYNANPESMKQAIHNFSLSKAPLKAMVLGDMLELGTFEKAEHESILKLSDTLNIDHAFFVGPAFYLHKASYPQFVFFTDNLEAKEYFEINHLADYRILLKGSRGIKLEILKEDLL